MLFGLFGCSENVLEFNDVLGFSCAAEKIEGTSKLRVRGLAFHSALAVKELKTTVEKNVMLIEIYLTPGKTGLSGRFDYQIEVPEAIDLIVFGTKRHPIWKRDAPQPL